MKAIIVFLPFVIIFEMSCIYPKSFYSEYIAVKKGFTLLLFFNSFYFTPYCQNMVANGTCSD